MRVGGITGDPCFREELVPYLSAQGGLQLAADGTPFDVTVAGGGPRAEVHSNLGDKQAAIAYFTVFVVTAPIAAAVCGAKDWDADAAADGTRVATDPSGAAVWSKALTVSIDESQRTLPSHDALQSAMKASVCQKAMIPRST